MLDTRPGLASARLGSAKPSSIAGLGQSSEVKSVMMMIELTSVWEAELVHAGHVHLELAWVRYQVVVASCVAARAVALRGAARGGLGPAVVLARRRCPLLARLLG